MKQELSIAVRALAEQVYRTGDLELSSFGVSRQTDAIRAHQLIQRSRPDSYTSEVTVSHTHETDTIILLIRGRIDGVQVEDGRVTIDEIKTTTRDPADAASDNNPVHWAQAVCYAAIHAAREGLEQITVQLTYCRLADRVTHEVRREYTAAELASFLQDTIDRYLAWAETVADWRKLRDASIETVTFPFEPFRPGQHELAGDVYNTIRHDAQLLVQAPTGIGKTMAVLFPAVKALGGGLTGMLFYLTARTTGQRAAEDALARLREQGLRLKSVTITAKDKVCGKPGAACTGEECPFAEGYYTRLPEARTDAFDRDGWDRETILGIAYTHRVCPFEFSLELSLWADCVIADYNYAFDPAVYLRRFFEDDGGDYTFLVDEAHNLVDRSREMFSADVAKTPFLGLRRQVKEARPAIAKALNAVNRQFLALRAESPQDQSSSMTDPPSGLARSFRTFTAAAERWLMRNEPAPYRRELLDRYFEAVAFLRVHERYDSTYATILERSGSDCTVRLFCIDPAPQMREALARGRASVFFSATLAPMHYFRTVLGIGEEAYELSLPSPFPSEHRYLAIAGQVSTRYRDRTATAADVAGLLGACAGTRTGNYLFFFPSYEYLERILPLFCERHPEIEPIVQERAMSEDSREAFIARFDSANQRTLAGFAVMGGIFGEGIDLAGDRLTGAAVIGVGLPGISPERTLIRTYFDETSGQGFDFAYRYPGINRVLQAAGRVIRSEHDRGVILLIDDRFATWEYRSLFPRDWEPVLLDGPESLVPLLEAFWNGNGDSI